MPGRPRAGLQYRQEYLEGEAEDKGAVVTVGEEQVEVPFGFYKKDVLMTRDRVRSGGARGGCVRWGVLVPRDQEESLLVCIDGEGA